MLVTHSAQVELPHLLKPEFLLPPSRPWAIGLLLHFRFIFIKILSSFRLFFLVVLLINLTLVFS
jgi:hypothetical protein